jgi:dTDP-4-amino-4,6-dideoxygalactose transaminase
LTPPPECGHPYYKYVALLAPGIDRDSLKQRLRDEHGVGMSGEVYARPLHHEPVFAEIPQGALPVAEDVCARQVCLPIHSDMRETEAELVVSALAAVLSDAEPVRTAATRGAHS